MTDFTINLVTILVLGLVLVGYIAYNIHLAVRNRLLSSIVLARSDNARAMKRKLYYFNR